MTSECRVDDCPLTRHEDEDVCYLHLEQDGKQRDLLLACLREQEEKGVIRMHGVYLVEADLGDLTLSLRNFRDSNLSRANFSNARLSRIGFDGATLDGMDLTDAILERVDMRRVQRMQYVRMHGVIFNEVFLPSLAHVGGRCAYDGTDLHDPLKAEAVYRILKETYKNQGDHETSGLCYEREMDMHRARSTGFEKLWLTALKLSCGYGERPRRAVITSMLLILGYAVAFAFLQLRGPHGMVGFDLAPCIYFSTVTFTTLGYGDIIPLGAARYLAATEAFLGAWMMALFVFVFCRRMVR